PADTTIQTHWGDARQFVERNQSTKTYDLVFGDAFNDFSVPWHLTTREFNEKINKMLADDGVYMINIIDAYESDARAEELAERRIKKLETKTKEDVEAIRKEGARDAEQKVKALEASAEAEKKWIPGDERRKKDRFGGFLGSWVKTAQLTFPHVYIFG